MTDKEKIVIDGVEYNPCNGCKLWNGHHCTGARSYEPNADKHKSICNEHMANQFQKVYQQLYLKTVECEKYEQALEEIENFTKKHCDFYCEHNRILDIISKAKDGTSEK